MKVDVRLKWEFTPVDSVGYLCCAPVCADLDGDGETEVFIGSYTRRLYSLDGKTGAIKWSYLLPQDLVGCNNVSLLTTTSKPSVIFGTEPNPTLYSLDASRHSDNRLLWRRPLLGQFVAGGIGCFRDTDGVDKIIALTRRRESPDRDEIRDGSAYLFDGETGRVIWGPIGEQDVCSSGPAVADLNNDGELEFVYGNHRWREIEFRGCAVCRKVKDGSVVWSYLTDDDPGANTMTISDINDDGEKEVIVTYCHYKDVVKPAFGTVVLAGETGTRIWERAFFAYWGVTISKVHGESVILACGSAPEANDVICVDGKDGKTIWKSTCGNNSKATPLTIPVKDKDSDYLIVGDSENNIFILDSQNGKLLFHGEYKSNIPPIRDKRYSKEAPVTGVVKVSACDIDSDGYWEILFSSMDNTIKCLDTNIPVPSGMGREFAMEGVSITRPGNFRE